MTSGKAMSLEPWFPREGMVGFRDVAKCPPSSGGLGRGPVPRQTPETDTRTSTHTHAHIHVSLRILVYMRRLTRTFQRRSGCTLLRPLEARPGSLRLQGMLALKITPEKKVSGKPFQAFSCVVAVFSLGSASPLVTLQIWDRATWPSGGLGWGAWGALKDQPVLFFPHSPLLSSCKGLTDPQGEVNSPTVFTAVGKWGSALQRKPELGLKAEQWAPCTDWEGSRGGTKCASAGPLWIPAPHL